MGGSVPGPSGSAQNSLVEFIHLAAVPGWLQVAVDLQGKRRAVVPHRVHHVEQGCAVLNEPAGEGMAQGMNGEVAQLGLADEDSPLAFVMSNFYRKARMRFEVYSANGETLPLPFKESSFAAEQWVT